MRLITGSLFIVLNVASCGPGAEEEGEVLFRQNCAVCHGADARGGGGAAVPGLSKTPSDLTRLQARNRGVFPLSQTIGTLEGYASGSPPGRRMTPLKAMASDRSSIIRSGEERLRASRSQAAVIRWLQSVQRP